VARADLDIGNTRRVRHGATSSLHHFGVSGLIARGDLPRNMRVDIR
jgi:hypothetical protein